MGSKIPGASVLSCRKFICVSNSAQKKCWTFYDHSHKMEMTKESGIHLAQRQQDELPKLSSLLRREPEKAQFIGVCCWRWCIIFMFHVIFFLSVFFQADFPWRPPIHFIYYDGKATCFYQKKKSCKESLETENKNEVSLCIIVLRVVLFVCVAHSQHPLFSLMCKNHVFWFVKIHAGGVLCEWTCKISLFFFLKKTASFLQFWSTIGAHVWKWFGV